MNWYLRAIQHYVDFKSRASRKEYWMFMLINVIIVIVLKLVGSHLENPNLLLGIYGLFIMIPSCAVSVRRLHDTNRSGWLVLLALLPIIGPLVLLFFKVQKGNPLTNRFGIAPL